MTELRKADVLEDIKTYPDYFFDIIYSDAPYNLSSEWFIDKDGRYKLRKKAKDFLNKWDGLDENNIDDMFKEANRTLKHGGYFICYSIDRQLGPFHYYAVKNGFEVCQSLYWFFMSNFPKASDVAKQIDKRFKCEREVVGKNPNGRTSVGQAVVNETFGYKENPDLTSPTHPIAKKYEGYKYSIAPLKQCLETIMVFHKPLKGKSYIDDIIACETETDIHSSCLNIEGERVEYSGTHPAEIYGDSYMKSGHSKNKITDELQSISGNDRNGVYVDETGRFPSQLLVDENAAKIIDEQTGIKTTSTKKSEEPFYSDRQFYSGDIQNRVFRDINDTGGGSKIIHICKPDSDIHPSCLNIEGEMVEYNGTCAYETDEMDLLKYQPKVSKSERNAGLEKIEGKNQNPCLKPISLNKHILNLFKTPNHTRIYIPFAGSGSEVIAAESVGYDEIYAAEINEDYCKIAEVRIIYWREKEAQDQSKIKNDTKPLKKKKEAPEVKSSEEDDFWG